MANVKITDLAADAAVTGVELVVVSDAASPKKVSITQIANFTVDTIEALTTCATFDGGDSLVMMENDTDLKPVVAEKVEQYIADTLWGKAAETVVDAADVLLLKDGATTEKTVTTAILATYMLAALEPSILDISDKTAKAVPAGADLFLIVDGTTPKKITYTELLAAVLGGIDTYITALSAVTSTDDTDVFYCIQSGTEKKVTLAQLAAHLSGKYKTLWIPALNTVTSATDGMDTEEKEYGTNDMTHYVLLGDGLAQNESVEWDQVMPEEWDRGILKAKVYWAPGDAAANVGELVCFQLSAGAISNDDPLDAAVSAPVEMTDAVIADDDLHVTAASSALTVGGVPALGDMIHFKLTRDYDYDNLGAGTAMDVDARIFGILIQYIADETPAAW